MSKVVGPYGRELRLLALAGSVAALTAACSQTTDAPVRGVASNQNRPGLNRPLFTEEAYGVSSSKRVIGNGPVPKGGGSFKLGSPYKVAGRWYVPREEPNYDREGTGSWYGDDFHGRKTANGEIFDRNALSAAHPTLPLPSYAYVTNVSNGRTVLVRVNDRGPYVSDRLIDLSHAAARALDYEDKGHARVRVRYAGRAPLNGDDRRERQFLAEQRWNGGRGYAPVAAYRPPQAPITPPQPFPEGTPGRWSPSAYRAAQAGKPTPDAPQKWAAAEPAGKPWRMPERSASEPYERPPSYQPTAAYAAPQALAGPPTRGPRDDAFRPSAMRTPAAPRAYVQIGMYRDKANAERIRRDLGSVGPVEVAPLAGAPGSELYRVRIGPMTAADANVAAARVAERGFGGGTVVFE